MGVPSEDYVGHTIDKVWCSAVTIIIYFSLVFSIKCLRVKDKLVFSRFLWLHISNI